MNLASLLKEYLISECGFHNWQVSNRFGREVIVYLSGRKLHFTLSGEGQCLVDCCLILGGMSTPENRQHNINTLFSHLDLRDPNSFRIIWEEMNNFLPKNPR